MKIFLITVLAFFILKHGRKAVGLNHDNAKKSILFITTFTKKAAF